MWSVDNLMERYKVSKSFQKIIFNFSHWTHDQKNVFDLTYQKEEISCRLVLWNAWQKHTRIGEITNKIPVSISWNCVPSFPGQNETDRLEHNSKTFFSYDLKVLLAVKQEKRISRSKNLLILGERLGNAARANVSCVRRVLEKLLIGSTMGQQKFHPCSGRSDEFQIR